jgi:hypothetical protein
MSAREEGMRIRVLGGGWYGCSIALGLLRDGHYVELHEKADKLFAGASGGNPARCHLGFHYPRSGVTQAACQEHQAEFMARYGHLTRGIPINLYAVAANDSLVDYASYVRSFAGRVEFVQVDPAVYGLQNVEGALLTGERHIVIDEARNWFTTLLNGSVRYGAGVGQVDDPSWDMTIDCTFCANEAENIERYEPCITGLLSGPTDRAVTIMDGQFGSIYPWNETLGLSSLTSAKYTPFSKTCRTWGEARATLDNLGYNEIQDRLNAMLDQMAHYWPECLKLYSIKDWRLTIRAMPRSAADSRLVDVVKVGDKALRVRAGKIDAVFHAERIVREFINGVAK